MNLEEFLLARLERYLTAVRDVADELVPGPPLDLLEPPGFESRASWEAGFMGLRLELRVGLGAVKVRTCSGVRWRKAVLVRHSWLGGGGCSPFEAAAEEMRRGWPREAARWMTVYLREASSEGLDVRSLLDGALVADVMSS